MKTSISIIFLFFLFISKNCFLGVGKSIATRSCCCGAINRMIPLIVGGRKIVFNKYPWLVLVLLRNQYHCGGTLISSHYVLTAGHCVLSSSGESLKPERLTILLGAHNRSNREERSRVYRRVKSIILHKDFHGDEVHDVHDIALMELDRKVTYSRHVGPVCLPEFLDEAVYQNPKGKVVGWGSESYTGRLSSIPLEAELDIFSNEKCENVTEYDFKTHFIEERGSMFCAYAYKRDACRGDSGSPFVVENSLKRMVQIGIVSWGIKCAEEGIPGVYTKLTSYMNWIKDNANITNYSCNF